MLDYKRLTREEFEKQDTMGIYQDDERDIKGYKEVYCIEDERLLSKSLCTNEPIKVWHLIATLVIRRGTPIVISSHGDNCLRTLRTSNAYIKSIKPIDPHSQPEYSRMKVCFYGEKVYKKGETVTDQLNLNPYELFPLRGISFFLKNDQTIFQRFSWFRPKQPL